MEKRIILASASPRRRELLENIGLDFIVAPSFIEENVKTLQDVEKVALKKVMDVSYKIDGNAIIIGSDTVVVTGNKILGKPANRIEAMEMLKLLSNKTHHVISAIAVYDTETDKTVKTSVKSEVTFRKLTDDEIQNYINEEDVLDKAGAYAIQGRAGMFVKEIKGDYFNIVGISVYKVAEILRSFGVNLL